MNFPLFSKSTLLTLFVLPLSLSYAELDFLSNLYYDSSKIYSVDDNVVLESDPSEIYTALVTVPVNTPPPNTQYWASSEEHTTSLTEENSDDLSTTPNDNFDQTTPGSPPTDEGPSFSSSLLEITMDENDDTEVTIVFASNSVSYALSEELDYELFDLDDSTFQLSFKESPDYEDPVDLDEDNIYEVVVVATNSNGTASQTVQITVQNVIESPVFTSSSSADFDSGASGIVYTASATDNATYSISGTDYLLFSINSATGDLTFNSSPNYNSPADFNSDNVYDIVIQAENDSGTSLLNLSVEINQPSLAPAKLINISTRGYVGIGDEVLIGGFVISGDQSKTVLVRTLGPSLASQGVSGSLSDPWVYVVNQATGQLVDSNDNWASAPGIDAISGTIYEPGDAKDSAMILTLEPGAYTAVVSGINNSTGVALIEVNEFDQVNSKLINISTRGYVGTGDEVLIGGFVISGDQSKTVLVRTLGPSLASQGVSGSLSDPWVYVVNQANPTVLIDSNDNWASAPGIDAISGTIYEPGDAKDSAMILTLEPGAYTAVVSGINNSTGVALIEVNEFE